MLTEACAQKNDTDLCRESSSSRSRDPAFAANQFKIYLWIPAFARMTTPFLILSD